MASQAMHPGAAPVPLPVRSPLTLPWLAAVDLMERLSFFGMNAILVLFLTASPQAAGDPGPGLGFSTAAAAAVAGSYAALVFLTPLLGGWLADRLLGSTLAVLLGGVVITSGHGLMAVSSTGSFWLGLLAIALGTGLLKPNVTVLVGATQPDDQARRDAAFSLFYMCTNIGAFLAPLLIGSLAQARGWHSGFAAAGVAMAIALLLFVVASARRRDLWRLTPLQPLPLAAWRPLLQRSVPIVATAMVLVAVHGWLRGFTAQGLALDLLVLVLIVAVVQLQLLWRTPGLRPEERRGVCGFFVVFAATVLFFLVSTQGGSVLITFAQQHADRHLGSWLMPTPWLMAVNPLGIIVFAPLLARLWWRLGERSPNPASKFVLAFALLAASLLLMLPSAFQADAGSRPPIIWLVLLLVLQTWAELLVLPVAMSAASHLAPAGLQGRVLALWYLGISLGAALGGQLFAALGQWGLGPFLLILALLVSGCTLFSLLLLPRLKPLLL